MTTSPTSIPPFAELVVLGPAGVTGIGLTGFGVYGAGFPGDFYALSASTDGAVRLVANYYELAQLAIVPSLYRHSAAGGLQPIGVDSGSAFMSGDGSRFAASVQGSPTFLLWTDGQPPTLTYPPLPSQMAQFAPSGISEDGRVVLGFAVGPVQGERPALWSEAGGFVELEDQLESQGIALPSGAILKGAQMSSDATALILILGFIGAEDSRYLALLESPLALELSTPYCTSGTSQQGCTPSILSQGTPSASLATGLQIRVEGLPAQKSGLLFYGLGQQLSVWDINSSSYLCVTLPVQRTLGQNSGGTAGACDGVLALDFNQWMQSHPGALGSPLFTGQMLYVQGWYRDPGAATGTNLSNGLRLTLFE